MKRWLTPFAVFYCIAMVIALVVAPIRAAMMPVAPAGGSPYQHLWDWVDATDRYINALNVGIYAAEGNTWAWFIFLYAGGPTIAAVVTCLLFGGRNGVARLARRMHPAPDPVHRRSTVRAYTILLCAYFSGALIYLLLGFAWGSTEDVAQTHAFLGDGIVVGFLILLLGMFIDEGGLLEELGWRGLGLPLLLRRFSPLAASLLLGFLWWAWHFPRELPDLATHVVSLAWWSGQSQFIATCLLMSIVITHFVIRTGGSVLPAIIIHGGSNVWGKALGTPIYKHLGFDLRLVVWILAAAAILWLTGKGLGASGEQPLSSPIDDEERAA